MKISKRAGVRTDGKSTCAFYNNKLWLVKSSIRSCTKDDQIYECYNFENDIRDVYISGSLILICFFNEYLCGIECWFCQIDDPLHPDFTDYWKNQNLQITHYSNGFALVFDNLLRIYKKSNIETYEDINENILGFSNFFIITVKWEIYNIQDRRKWVGTVFSPPPQKNVHLLKVVRNMLFILLSNGNIDIYELIQQGSGNGFYWKSTVCEKTSRQLRSVAGKSPFYEVIKADPRITKNQLNSLSQCTGETWFKSDLTDIYALMHSCASSENFDILTILLERAMDEGINTWLSVLDSIPENCEFSKYEKFISNLKKCDRSEWWVVSRLSTLIDYNVNFTRILIPFCIFSLKYVNKQTSKWWILIGIYKVFLIYKIFKKNLKTSTKEEKESISNIIKYILPICRDEPNEYIFSIKNFFYCTQEQRILLYFLTNYYEDLFSISNDIYILYIKKKKNKIIFPKLCCNYICSAVLENIHTIFDHSLIWILSQHISDINKNIKNEKNIENIKKLLNFIIRITSDVMNNKLRNYLIESKLRKFIYWAIYDGTSSIPATEICDEIGQLYDICKFSAKNTKILAEQHILVANINTAMALKYFFMKVPWTFVQLREAAGRPELTAHIIKMCASNIKDFSTPGISVIGHLMGCSKDDLYSALKIEKYTKNNKNYEKIENFEKKGKI
eukprot:GHVL01012487.1.p1 GENE.GHVL01012487.1~~GHVL01012487.1.p1  ORF type:complete len:675 (+),score=129.72 GHVL01012487.1:1520-3544(+)